MPGLQLSGLASGMDTGAIVDAIMQFKSIPVVRLQQTKAAVQTQISTLGKIQSAANDLQDIVDQFKDLQAFKANAATSSNESVATVTADSTATAGTWSLNVSGLASPEIDRSGSFSSASDIVKEGTLTIQVWGESAVDVTIGANMTLTDVADAINASGAKVQASVVDTGTGAYLEVKATKTGYDPSGWQSDALVLTESYTGTTGQELQMVQLQQAENAQLTLDGISVVRTTNSIDDLIAGVTIELVDKGSTTIDTSPDASSMKDKVQQFVDAYNKLYDLIQGELQLDKDQSRTGKLAGDPTLQSLKRTLVSTATGILSGIDGTWNALSQIGVQTNAEGHLEIDESKFDDAVSSNLDGVANLFAQANTGLFTKLSDALSPYTDSLEGFLKLRADGLNDQTRRLDDRIERYQKRLDAEREALVAQFSSMEQIISQFNTQAGSLASSFGSGGGLTSLLGASTNTQG